MTHGYPDFEGNKSGIYLKPEWAAKEGFGLNESGSSTNKVFGEYVFLDHTVPAGKKLYITQYSFGSTANAAVDGDKNQFCYFQIEDITVAAFPIRQTANGGAGLSLNQPIVIPASHLVQFLLMNFANHACDLRVSFSGYEV